MQQKSIYLAAPFFSDGQHTRINQVVAALQQNPTIGEIFLPEKHPYSQEEFGSLGWQDATFRLDVNHIYQADIVVAIADYKLEEADNEMDSGTAFEVGLAYGTHTPVAVIQFDPKKEINLMIAQSLTTYFDLSQDHGLQKLAEYDFNVMLPQRANRPVI